MKIKEKNHHTVTAEVGFSFSVQKNNFAKANSS